MSEGRSMPTVVVARTPAPGREAEFEAWLRMLVAEARGQPGHVHSDIQPPNEIHPGEWVIVYQFSDADLLDAWMHSPVRAELMAGGADLIAGPGREQVIALDRAAEPVTAVASFRVKPGFEHRYDEFHRRLVERLALFTGFIGSEMFRPVEGVQDETVVVFSFDSRQHLDDWLGSEARQQMLSEIDPFLDGERTINVVGGFAGWFGAPGRQVPKWKQACVVLLAIVPTTLAITAVRRQLAPDLHWVTATVLGNVVGVAALTWLLMPALTRLLANWLE